MFSRYGIELGHCFHVSFVFGLNMSILPWFLKDLAFCDSFRISVLYLIDTLGETEEQRHLPPAGTLPGVLEAAARSRELR